MDSPSSSLQAPAAEQQPVVYLPPTNIPPPPDLPDSAYDLTSGEAQQVLASIAKRARDDSVLRTGKMRERDERVARRWDETKIRVKFADRTIIQQTFPSSAKLVDVYAFVRSSLAPEHASAKFTLYIPPSQTLPETPPLPIPKSKLPPSKRNQPQPPPKLTLAEHELSPSAMLSVRFDEAELNRTDTRVLRAELLERAEELPVPAASTESAVEAPKAEKVEEVKPEGKSGGGKMPKWFKGPGKK